MLILWLGWFGFNGGSQLALGSAADAVAMSNVLVNTNLAARPGWWPRWLYPAPSSAAWTCSQA